MIYLNGKPILLLRKYNTDNAAELQSIKEAILMMGGTVASNANFRDIPNAIETIPVGDATYTFVEDSDVAYKKSILSGASSCAEISKVGGMSYKCTDDTGNLFPYPYKSVDASSSAHTEENGVVTVTNNSTGYDEVFIFTATATLPAGTYILDLGNPYFSSVCLNASNNPHIVSVDIEKIENGKWRIIASNIWDFTGINVEIDELTVQSIYPMLYEEYKPISWKNRSMPKIRHAKVNEIKSMSKNLAFSRGWSAKNPRQNNGKIAISNIYGTTISATSGDFISVTQTLDHLTTVPSQLLAYQYGYFMYLLKEHLEEGRTYRLSFDINIKNKPLTNTVICVLVNGFKLQYFKLPESGVGRVSSTFVYNRNTETSAAYSDNFIEFRCSGMSFDIGNVLITEEDVTDTTYTPAVVLDTFTIPEAVRNREGYGLGISNDVYNSIEYTERGVDETLKCKELVFNGSENWQNVNDSKGQPSYFAVKIGNYGDVVDYVNISDQYASEVIAVSNANKGLCVVNSKSYNDSRVLVRPNDFATLTLADFKLNLANHPVTVIYALAEPIVTDITDLMPIDNHIAIEAEGYAESVNDDSFAVPNTICYVRKVG